MCTFYAPPTTIWHSAYIYVDSVIDWLNIPPLFANGKNPLHPQCTLHKQQIYRMLCALSLAAITFTSSNLVGILLILVISKMSELCWLEYKCENHLVLLCAHYELCTGKKNPKLVWCAMQQCIRTSSSFYIQIMVIHFGIECWWNSIFGHGFWSLQQYSMRATCCCTHVTNFQTAGWWQSIDDVCVLDANACVGVSVCMNFGHTLRCGQRHAIICQMMCASALYAMQNRERHYGKMEIIMRTFRNYLEINADNYILSKIKTVVASGEHPIAVHPCSLFHFASKQLFGITWKLL